MADLRKLKDRAADLQAKGKLEKAAHAYREVLAIDPRDLSSLQKLAEVLRRAGRDEESVATYRQVADRYAHDGFLIKAIAVCKIILEIDPSHVATQAELAGLYARRGVAVPDLVRTEPSPPDFASAPGLDFGTEPVESEVLSMDAEDIVELPIPNGGPPPLLMTPPRIVTSSHPVFVPKIEQERAPGVAPPPMPAVAAMARSVPPRSPAPLSQMVSGELLGVTATPYETILSAAAAAAEAGFEAEVVIEGEPIDEPLAEDLLPEDSADEPLSPPPSSGSAPRVPRIPIFSDLAPRAFVALTEGAVLRDMHVGEAIIREGEAGMSLFVIATGKVRVEKKNDRGETVLLAKLGEGSFFGEMALLSGAPRAAAVIPEEEGQLLEITAELLRRLCREHPHVARSFTRFCRRRLLANTMATSPLFGPFDKVHRKELMRRFRSREVRAGDVIVREGDPTDGLYVVLSGAVDIRKQCEGEEILAGKLTEGDVFGEMSCLTKKPASATVVASRAGTLLRLPREDFDEIVSGYPQILELVSELADDRSRSLEAIVGGSAEFTTDGLVLI